MMLLLSMSLVACGIRWSSLGTAAKKKKKKQQQQQQQQSRRKREADGDANGSCTDSEAIREASSG